MTQTLSHNAAQICEKGHLITDKATEYPDRKKSFCDVCGARTLTKCRHCKEDICGAAISSYPSFHKMPVPSNCIYCGKRFPWTKGKSIRLPKPGWKSIIVTITAVTAPLGWCYSNITPVREIVDKQVSDWIRTIGPKANLPEQTQK